MKSKEEQEEIKILKSKVKFIELVVDKKINIFNKKKEEIIKILKGQNLYLIKDEPEYDLSIERLYSK